MADFRKLVYVNAEGDFEEHDAANDQLQLHSLQLGAGAVPVAGGASLTGNIDLNNVAYVVNAPDPVEPGQLANKRYVDAVSAGFFPKYDVVAATTAADVATGDISGYTYVPALDSQDALDVNSITWQATNITRISFNGTPNFSKVLPGDELKISDATNAVNNGIFIINAVDNTVLKFIDVINAAKTSAVGDEASDSPAVGAIVTPVVWTGVAAAPEIDGVTLVDGDRLLLKDLTTGTTPTYVANGIFTYDATAQGLRRAADADNISSLSNSEVKGGMFVFVTSGTANNSKGYLLKSPETIADLGVDGLEFTTFSTPGAIEADEIFLARIGNTFHFEYLSENNIIVGGAALSNDGVRTHPVVFNTAGDTAGVGGYTGGSNQIEVDETTGLVIKKESIMDDQIDTVAAIDGSKLVLGAGYVAADYTGTNTFITTLATTSTLELAMENVIGYLTSLDDETDGFSGGDKISITPIAGYDSSLDTVQEMLEELSGPMMVADEAIAIGSVVNPSRTVAGRVEIYDAITALDRPIGIAVTSAAVAGDSIKVLVSGQTLTTAGLSIGLRYFWNGSALVSTVPATSGVYVYQIGTALSATKLLIDIDYIKKNV